VFSPVGVPMAATRSLVSVWTAVNVAMVIRVATIGMDPPARQVGAKRIYHVKYDVTPEGLSTKCDNHQIE